MKVSALVRTGRRVTRTHRCANDNGASIDHVLAAALRELDGVDELDPSWEVVVLRGEAAPRV